MLKHGVLMFYNMSFSTGGSSNDDPQRIKISLTAYDVYSE
jgi:hypothetical protein